MKLSIELFKGKELKDNTFPILFRIYHNKKNKYKSSGISTLPKFWNADKKRLTCREHDYKLKNEILSREFNRILDRIRWFETNLIDYDIDFIFSEVSLNDYQYSKINDDGFDSNNFIDIMRAKANSRTRFKTRESNLSFCNRISNMYNNVIRTNSINQMFVSEFRAKLDRLESSAHLKNSLIFFFSSSYEFGISNRWIENPYNFKIPKFNIIKSNKREITFEETSEIINCYKKNLYTEKGILNSKGLMIFILDIAFQGLSPFDLANIKIKDLKLCKISNCKIDYERYYNDNNYKRNCDNEIKSKIVLKINTFRSKTNIEVPICTDIYSILPIIHYLTIGKSKDDYLLDCFSKNKSYTESQLHVRSQHYFYNLKTDLNREIQLYNNVIDKGIQIRKLTYYYARHCFINYLDNMNVSRNLIRKMIGHKQNTLDDNYINRITDWEQSEIIGKMFNNVKPIKEILIEKYSIEEVEKQINDIALILS